MAIGTLPYNAGEAGGPGPHNEWEGTPGEGANPAYTSWPNSFAQPQVFGLSGGEGSSNASRHPGPFTTRVESAVSSLLPPKLENMNG